ncbi:MAG: phosphate ABC transporter permease PstA [Chloroflexi bacterium]|nr:phosphate ABC transporter permease PstA [Chloroflexota bacterium]
MLNILNSNFGYVVYVDKVNPQTLAVDGVPLENLPSDTLASIFRENVSNGLFTRYDREIPLTDRSQSSIYELILDFVIVPEVKQQWSLWESLTRRAQIQSIAATDYPEGYLVFESWVDYDFIKSPQSSFVEIAGVRTAILGSLWTIGIAILFAFPVGVGAAIYLQEYAADNWLNRVIRTNINNLAGVPSIIYGILGLAIFVRALEPLTSGAIFSGSAEATASGRTILSAGLTLALLVLPLIIINAQEAIKAVPNSLRNASYGLGATRWQTIWNHVLPGALPGILTGTILAISRAIGETAPLVVIGASTFIQADPSGPFSKFTTLPIQIFQWTSRPQEVFRNLAAAASLVLLALLLTMNATAILLRNRYGNRN